MSLRRSLLVVAVAGAPLIGSWACGGGEANTQNTAPTASAQPSSAPTETTSAASTASTAPTPSATASAAPVTLPPEFTAARDKLDAVMQKVMDVFTSNAKNATAATCDKVATAVLKIVKDPDTKKTAQAYAAEYAKLNDAQRKAHADATMKSSQAQITSMPSLPNTADGGALCEHNKKFGDMAAALGELIAMSAPSPAPAKKP